MPRYQSRPRIITAVQFDANNMNRWPESVKMDMEGDHVVFNRLHKSYIKLKDGDYIRIDDPNDNYPIDEATFAASYDLMTGENTDGHAQPLL